MAGGNLQLRVTVDADRASDEFKRARRELNKDVKAGLLEAAREEALPYARIKVPSFARQHLTARATTRRAYITTTGPRWIGRTVGLLEFGGTVKADIFPKDAKALQVAPGVFRAAVHTPRHYKAQRRITKAVQARSHQIEAAVAKHVVRKLKID